VSSYIIIVIGTKCEIAVRFVYMLTLPQL